MKNLFKIILLALCLTSLSFFYNNNISISELEREMFNTDGFLRNYYLKNVPDSYRIKDDVQVEHSTSFSSIDLEIDILNKTSISVRSDIADFCSSSNISKRPTIAFKFRNFQFIDSVLIGSRRSSYVLDLNSEFLQCFRNVVIISDDENNIAKILIRSPNLGFLKLTGDSTTPIDIFVKNIQIDYLKHPYLQGEIFTSTNNGKEHTIDVKLETEDSFGLNNEGWQQKRSYYKYSDIKPYYNNKTGESCEFSYGVLYKSYEFDIGKSSVEKKKFTNPHFGLSTISPLGSENEIKISGISMLSKSKTIPEISDLMIQNSMPENGDKVVIFCDNSNHFNQFRITNIRNYSFDNITINSSGKVSLFSGNNFGKGTINKYNLKRWHWKSSRLVTAKSGFLTGGNRGPLHLANSIITRVFDDGFNTFTPAIKFAKLINIDKMGNYHFCVEGGEDSKVGDMLQIFQMSNSRMLGHLRLVNIRPENLYCNINSKQLGLFVFKVENTDSRYIDIAKNYNANPNTTNTMYQLTYLSKLTRKNAIENMLSRTISDLDYGNYIIGFNENLAGKSSIIENNVIGANRHSGITVKSPQTTVRNNVILMADYYPIHIPVRLEVFHPEGLMARDSEISHNFIDSHNAITPGIGMYVKGAQDSISQTFPSNIEINDNFLKGCGISTKISKGNLFGVSTSRNFRDTKECE